MSLDHLKKQAKGLKQHLPDFLAQQNGNLTLSACQEIIAKCSGYPSWHTAVSRLTASEVHGQEGPEAGLKTQLVAVMDDQDAGSLIFRYRDTALAESVTDELDEFSESTGLGDRSVSKETTTRLIELCRKLVTRDPDFLDGYAHLVGALHELDAFAEAIAEARPAFDRAVALIPQGFKGHISYWNLSNRPFHRLAANLVICYYGLETKEGDQLGSALAKQMYAWWKNDNLGFRNMLTAKQYRS